MFGSSPYVMLPWQQNFCITTNRKEEEEEEEEEEEDTFIQLG